MHNCDWETLIYTLARHLDIDVDAPDLPRQLLDRVTHLQQMRAAQQRRQHQCRPALLAPTGVMKEADAGDTPRAHVLYRIFDQCVQQLRQDEPEADPLSLQHHSWMDLLRCYGGDFLYAQAQQHLRQAHLLGHGEAAHYRRREAINRVAAALLYEQTGAASTQQLQRAGHGRR